MNLHEVTDILAGIQYGGWARCTIQHAELMSPWYPQRGAYLHRDGQRSWGMAEARHTLLTRQSKPQTKQQAAGRPPAPQHTPMCTDAEQAVQSGARHMP